MGKVLVKSAMYQYQMGPDGLQRYYTLGGSGGRAQPGEVRGRTKRDRALGLTGALAGAAFGLAGESRSAGGFAGNIISGAEQGSRFGRGLANLATTRTRQARADMEQQAKDDYAKQRAQADFEYRQQNPSLATRMNPMNINRRRFEAEQGRLQQARETTQRTLDANEQLGRDLASLGKEKLRQDKREAKDRGKSLKDYRREKPALELASSMDEQRINAFNQMLDTAPRLGEMAQQSQVPQQIQPAEGSVAAGNGTNADNNRMLANEGNMDHQMNTESIQSELGSQDDEGGGDEELPRSNELLQSFIQRQQGQSGAKNE